MKTTSKMFKKLLLLCVLCSALPLLAHENAVAIEENKQASFVEKTKKVLSSKPARTAWAAGKILNGTFWTALGLFVHGGHLIQGPTHYAKAMKKMKDEAHRDLKERLWFNPVLFTTAVVSSLPVGTYSLYSGCKDIKNLYYEKHENLDHEIMEENHE